MNGRNKKKINWRMLFNVIGCLYIIIVIALAFLIYNIPSLYTQLEQNEVNEIRSQLNERLAVDQSIVAQEIEKFASEYKLDIVVKQEAAVIFSNMAETSFSKLKAETDNDYLSYHGAFEVKNGNGIYQVWLAIHKMSSQVFFEIIMSILMTGIVILSVIMIVLVVILFRQLILPIRRLQKNIMNLKEYRFDELQSSSEMEYDALSEDLSIFSEDLLGKMSKIDDNYSSLERELQEQKERTVYQKRLATAIIHNLKTPINIAMIQNERLQGYLNPNDELELKILQDLADIDDQLMNEISEALLVMNEEEIVDNNATVINVVAVAKDMLKLFATLFEKRHLTVSLDAPKEIYGYFQPLELKQVFHNIISNACQYADEYGEFELSMFAENGFLVIEAYNDKENTENIDFEQVFDLFYHINDEDINFGSGIGMYTIKSMVSGHGGSATFEKKDNGVLLTIILPIEEVRKDA
ncbi:sensor histidine kinase [Culicoidibacter larvae]|uniref:histidine kinase n=1 Tax=Culicoidibacter larvae TaxID=2579976 RepID=A0A5R8QG47_9FIRM|nr:HAMP domain-containing sensor histidine kinase [Culicoidibacter larvae]TLG76746.1 HAMP domain-containing histidine kinase [Culicoidibacter larvae]